MTIPQIHQSIESVIKFYSEHPEKALSPDKAAVAVIQGELRCKAEGPNRGAQLRRGGRPRDRVGSPHGLHGGRATHLAARMEQMATPGTRVSATGSTTRP